MQGDGPFDQREGSGFVTKAHRDQREIIKKRPIFWLFFEKGFQFGAGLSPTFLSGGVIAGDFLRPAQPKAQFATEITQVWLGLG